MDADMSVVAPGVLRDERRGASTAPQRMPVGEYNSEDGALVVWEVGLWRCERRTDQTGPWLHLYRADELALSRPVRDADQIAFISEAWRAYADGTAAAVMPEPSRRISNDRRRATRGGRRHDDPHRPPPDPPAN